MRVNFAELVSWQGFTQAVAGPGNGFAVAFGWGLSAATILAIAWVWYAGGRKADFNGQLALASICIVLISPHTLYYDSGIVLIAFVVLLNRLGRLNTNLIVGVWAAGLVQLLSPSLGVSLSFIPVVVMLAVAVFYLWTSSIRNVATQPG